MSEEELRQLHVKNNIIIEQLNSLTNPTPQTPLPTQVKDVEYTIHDPGKTIRFQLRPKDFQVAVWSRKRAKREHNKLKEEAKNTNSQ
jgi:hypothetical protein